MKTIQEIAEIENLELIETTTGNNGYPQNLKHAIVGFESFEQAQEIAEKYGLRIESFRRKDGWQLWERNYLTMYAPFQNSAEDFGDNYNEIDKIDESEFFEREIKPIINDFEDFESLETFIESKKKVWEEIQNMEDNELVITHYGEYYETISKESMVFSHDTWNSIIGLI